MKARCVLWIAYLRLTFLGLAIIGTLANAFTNIKFIELNDSSVISGEEILAITIKVLHSSQLKRMTEMLFKAQK